jgi:hypothetical protein
MSKQELINKLRDLNSQIFAIEELMSVKSQTRKYGFQVRISIADFISAVERSPEEDVTKL